VYLDIRRREEGITPEGRDIQIKIMAHARAAWLYIIDVVT